MYGSNPLNVLLESDCWNSIDPDARSLKVYEHFRCLTEVWKGSEHAGVYDEALNLLRKCYTFMSHFEDRNDENERIAWG
jgi:hypothetical protein